MEAFGLSLSGINVNSETALASSAVYRAIDILSGLEATLPLSVYKRLSDGGREVDESHDTYRLIKWAPNSLMIQKDYRKAVSLQKYLTGNGIAEIIHEHGRPITLIPIQSKYITIKINSNRTALRYVISGDGRGDRTLDQTEVLHEKIFSKDGLIGRTPIQVLRETIGTGLQMQQFANEFIKGGTFLGGVLTTEKKANKEAKEDFRNQINEKYTGSGSRGKIMTLWEGMKFTPLGMPLKDAEFLESRQFNILEIARIFGVPPHLLMNMESSTYSNIVHQSIEFLMYTLDPHLIGIEQEYHKKLLREDEKGNMFYKFNRAALLKTDTLTLYKSFEIAIKSGFLNPNEARALIERNKYEGGEAFVIPSSGGGSSSDEKLSDEEQKAFRELLDIPDIQSNGEITYKGKPLAQILHEA